MWNNSARSATSTFYCVYKSPKIKESSKYLMISCHNFLRRENTGFKSFVRENTGFKSFVNILWADKRPLGKHKNLKGLFSKENIKH